MGVKAYAENNSQSHLISLGHSTDALLFAQSLNESPMIHFQPSKVLEST